MLNAYSISSVGLYNGKSGIALCLFEIANYLNDKNIEENAFELLQESLALSNKNTKAHIDFSNGLIGIAFVLLYLIKNRFIDADFEELFREQTDQIQSQLKEKDVFSEKDLSLIYFLELYFHYSKTTNDFTLANKILDDIGESIEKQMITLYSFSSNTFKFNISSRFNKYLKIASFCTDYTVPKSLINQYINLYEHKKIASHFITGYYLKRILVNKPDMHIADTIKATAIQNVFPNIFTLTQRIDLLYLLNQEDQYYQRQIDLLEQDILDTNSSNYEKKIIQSISNQGLIAGYGFGIARLLLYWIYKENKKNGQDCSRFKYIF
jgi:hypothetical protein